MKTDMRSYCFLFLFSIASITVNTAAVPGDSAYLPAIRYSKKELKKEITDIKSVDKQFKEWQKAIKQNNVDYLNSVFSKTMNLLEKEHNELSNRISIRSKELVHSDTPTSNSEDKPKVYNSELKDQIIHVNKQDIMRKKAESEYLSKYINVIRNEKTLITKLKNVKTFDGQTPASSYQEISNDVQAFKKEMDTEIVLMRNETGKK